MQLDQRKQKVLLAIVHDYVATAEPVGSRTIARKYKLGVSPATVRNEMADLEEQGYIEQPHTSAGRIPTERGYRYYVDILMKKQQLSKEEEELIRREYLTKIKDVGDVIKRTGLLLSQLTRYTALVLTPQMGASYFKHIQLVSMNLSQAMVIVVMDNGIVHHRMINVPESINNSDMETITRVLNAKLQGLTMESIRKTILKEIYFELSRHKFVLDLAFELIHGLTRNSEDRIFLGGVFNILNQPEFHNVEKVKTLLSLLEQERLLRDLLLQESPEEGVTVRIGGEMDHLSIKECSMISAPYLMRGKKLGYIGVLGPTRMEYAKVIGIIDYITKSLSQTLERMYQGSGK